MDRYLGTLAKYARLYQDIPARLTGVKVDGCLINIFLSFKWLKYPVI